VQVFRNEEDALDWVSNNTWKVKAEINQVWPQLP